MMFIFLQKRMDNDEQTEEYEDIFYIFTFEEEDRKEMKINDVPGA